MKANELASLLAILILLAVPILANPPLLNLVNGNPSFTFSLSNVTQALSQHNPFNYTSFLEQKKVKCTYPYTVDYFLAGGTPPSAFVNACDHDGGEEPDSKQQKGPLSFPARVERGTYLSTPVPKQIQTNFQTVSNHSQNRPKPTQTEIFGLKPN